MSKTAPGQGSAPAPATGFHTREPLNQSAAALSGSFAPTCRFENLEIRKGFLQFPNLNLEQNTSLTTLAIESEVPLIQSFNQESVSEFGGLGMEMRWYFGAYASLG